MTIIPYDTTAVKFQMSSFDIILVMFCMIRPDVDKDSVEE